ncbi:hypothetical protein PVAND_012996 [Polypedilum vanderplanki]|uniref:Pseudouridine synthase I TruA alpha/beta domain-containing protein n=1 Tax=Polypedilum vanderplanki TaxID=319348 RepID=A0A9J6CQ42_POLVA|nr:hypothetical protein PVAND_012996 [Polypedilum vanderplanki]
MDKVKVNKTKKNLSREELMNLTKEDLVDRIIKLEAFNVQLKNIIEKRVNEKNQDADDTEHSSRRNFDFSKHHKRHILLKFCYLGWSYNGYVVQDDTLETIEYHLFKALKKVCLIESRETSNYNRCGRTDKGVSAFDQVISIDIRSRFEPKDQLTEKAVNEEINYCMLLNKVLPKDIRVISWMPLVTPTYSARFDCTHRTYKYFFPRGELDIDLMKEACSYLIGSHDFRNLCKMDVGNGVVNYIRRLDNVEIKLLTKNDVSEEFDMFYLEITGSAFLWHMIRCIVSVLLLIGDKKESPDVIKELLDIKNHEQKPQYSLASEIPLNLFFCNFREDTLSEDDVPINTEMLNKWYFNEENLREVIIEIQEHWCTESVKSAMIFEMLRVLQSEYGSNFPDKPKIMKQMASLNRDTKRKEYQKLFERQKCSSLEERIEHYTKKRKLIKTE